MAQRMIYHWKHGWIPLDHYAALSKAHGRESGARLLEKRLGLQAGDGKSRHLEQALQNRHSGAGAKRFTVQEVHPALRAKGIAGGSTHVVRDDHAGGNVAYQPDGRLAYFVGRAAAQRFAADHNARHANGQVPTYEESQRAKLEKIDAETQRRAAESLHNSATMALRPSPVGKDFRTMTPAERIKAAEIMFGTGSKQHQAAKKKFGGKSAA
jgi:hypothetical protein